MMNPVLRIRGLPYSARADDVVDFFKDIKLHNGRRGVYFPQGPNGRSNGEAFVELESTDDIDKALKLHHENMGKRYIEVFRSDKGEMHAALGRNMHGNFGNREYVVRLRGLPYDTEKKEIFAFFNALDIAPNGIGLLVDHLGRSTGEAYVQFTSSEMLARAKEKHMEKIGHRYIEIFESTMMEANMAIQRQIDINMGAGSGGPNGPIMNGPRGGGRDMGPPAVNYGNNFNEPPPMLPPRGSGPPYGGGGSPMNGGGPGPYNGGPGPFVNGPRGAPGGGGGRPGPYSRPNMMNENRGGGPMSRGGPMMRGSFGGGGGPGPMMGPDNWSNGPNGRPGAGPGPGPGDRRGGMMQMNMGDNQFDQGTVHQSTTGHSIRMRGLPFSAGTDEVTSFLAPLQPVNIQLRFGPNGRPNGVVDVDFANHDEAKEAMKKDGDKIGSRYIELFLNSTPMGNAGGRRSPGGPVIKRENDGPMNVRSSMGGRNTMMNDSMGSGLMGGRNMMNGDPMGNGSMCGGPMGGGPMGGGPMGGGPMGGGPMGGGPMGGGPMGGGPMGGGPMGGGPMGGGPMGGGPMGGGSMGGGPMSGGSMGGGPMGGGSMGGGPMGGGPMGGGPMGGGSMGGGPMGGGPMSGGPMGPMNSSSMGGGPGPMSQMGGDSMSSGGQMGYDNYGSRGRGYNNDYNSGMSNQGWRSPDSSGPNTRGNMGMSGGDMGGYGSRNDGAMYGSGGQMNSTNSSMGNFGQGGYSGNSGGPRGDCYNDNYSTNTSSGMSDNQRGQGMPNSAGEMNMGMGMNGGPSNIGMGSSCNGGSGYGQVSGSNQEYGMGPGGDSYGNYQTGGGYSRGNYYY